MRRLIAILTLLAPFIVRADIAFVSSTSAMSATATSQASASFALTAGNLLVVSVQHPTSTTVTLSDTAANTFSIVSCSATYGTLKLEVWYVANALGNASDVVTATQSASGSIAVATAQYSGVGHYSPLDSCAAGATSGATGTTYTSPPFTLSTSGNVVVFSAPNSTTHTYTAGTNYTVRTTGAGVWTAIEGFLAAPSGSQTATISWDTADAASMVAMAFHPPVYISGMSGFFGGEASAVPPPIQGTSTINPFLLPDSF